MQDYLNEGQAIKNTQITEEHSDENPEATEESSDLGLRTSVRDKHLTKIRQMNIFGRTFRTLQFGSMRGVVLMFLRLTLGAGIFTLPFYVSKFGYIMGIIFIALAGFLSLESYNDIIEASNESNKNSYFELIEHYLGRRYLNVFKVTYFLDLSSTPICSMIVIYSLMKFLLGVLGLAKEEWIINKYTGAWKETNPQVILIRGLFFGLFYCISIPFFLKKQLFFLQKANMLIILALSLLMIYVIIELPFFGIHYEKGNERTTEAFKEFDQNWFENIFALLMAYYAQPFIFSLKEQLMYPTLDRMKKTTRITMIGETAIFILIGFMGYYCLGDKYITEMVYARVPYEGKNKFSEVLYQILLVVFFLCVLMGLAIYNPTIRDYFYEMFNWDKKNKRTYYLVSLVPFFCFALFCFIKPSITFVLNFSGVTFSNFNGYIIPGLIKAIRTKGKSKWAFYWALLKVYILMVFGMIAFVFMMINAYKDSQKE